MTGCRPLSQSAHEQGTSSVLCVFVADLKWLLSVEVSLGEVSTVEWHNFSSSSVLFQWAYVDLVAILLSTILHLLLFPVFFLFTWFLFLCTIRTVGVMKKKKEFS